MNRFGRWRGIGLILLLSVLLIAPTVECALHGDDEHTKLGAGPFTAVAVDVDTHLHGMSDHFSDHCDEHLNHCIEKAVLRSGGEAVAALPWPALIAVVALIAFALAFTCVRCTRGPPDGPLPVLNGQSILTKFCIARV